MALPVAPSQPSDTIFRWLANQPKTFDSSSAHCQSSASPSRRKRVRTFSTPSPNKRRRPLHPTNANLAQPSMGPLQGHIELPSPTKVTRPFMTAGNVRSPNGEEPGEGYGDVEWEDSALLASRASLLPDHRGRNHTGSLSRPRLTNIPTLNSGSSQYDYVETASSTASGLSRKRDRSPTKSLADLKLLNKPVDYISDEDTVRGRVPEDVREVWFEIRRLCKGHGYIPRTLYEHFGEIEDDEELVHDQRSTDDLHFELKQMKAVKTQAHEIEGDSETQWYCSVHWPILTAAFHDQPFMQPKVVTHARPIKDFLPKIGKQYTEAKLVDLAVNLVPSLSVNITQWLASQPQNYRTVNQSLSASLTQNPTIISIEVKTSQGTEVAAMVQVGIWISAWHERVQRLHETRQMVVTLPVIITSVHEWKLYFAVDRGDRIEVLRFPWEIGGTLSLSKVYRLLAVLRRLGGYAKNVYEPWFLKTFFQASGFSE